MDSLDLAQIRAQLRAAAEDRRPPPRGPLGPLRSLIGGRKRPPLLGAAPSYAPRPAPPAPPAPPALLWEGDDAEEPLLLAEPLDLPTRRNAFGKRPEPETDPRPAGGASRFAAPTDPAMDSDMVEAIRRRRPSLMRRPEEAHETPFLPEDLADAGDGDIERIYSEAGLATAPPPASLPADSPLLRLEQRLLEEHMLVIGAIAGRAAHPFTRD